MQIDPHELGERLSSCRKDSQEEKFLVKLNMVLSTHYKLTHYKGSESCNDFPIIYIIGAPRSGTTLLSQVLAKSLPIGYINNLIARFWQQPSIGIRLSKSLLGEKSNKDVDFTSSHGKTNGVVGPHEFGYFWRDWLGLDRTLTHHLTSDELRRVNKNGLKHVLNYDLLATFAKPLLFKNVICGFQAPFLTSIHRNSLFIHIERDLFSTCSSILKARNDRYGAYDNWWSLKPSTYPLLKEIQEPARQVVHQVYDCRKEFADKLNNPDVFSMNVTYEELCDSPCEVVEKICDELKRFSCTMKPDLSNLSKFTIARPAEIPTELSSNLSTVLAAF